MASDLKKEMHQAFVSFRDTSIRLPAILIRVDDIQRWTSYLSEHFPQWKYKIEEEVEDGITHVFRTTWIRLSEVEVDQP